MPSSDNQSNLYTQQRIYGGGTFHKATVRIKKIVCFQIIRHAETQNLVTIKQGEEKNSYGPKHVIKKKKKEKQNPEKI